MVDLALTEEPAPDNVTGSDWNSTMNHSNDGVSFIFTPYAFGVSGVFVWSALFLTCFQVSKGPIDQFST